MRESRRLINRDAFFPITGTAAGVGNGENVYLVKIVAVVNSKWKAPEMQSLYLGANFKWPPLRPISDFLDDKSQLIKELGGCSGIALEVKSCGSVGLGSGLQIVCDPFQPYFARSSAMTFSAGMPLTFPDSISSRRLSSSAFHSRFHSLRVIFSSGGSSDSKS